MKSAYEKATKGVFEHNRAVFLKTGKMPTVVHMVYDRPDSVGCCLAINLRLRKHNMAFRWGGRHGTVVQYDYSKPVPRNWHTIADTIVFHTAEEYGVKNGVYAD